MELSLIHIFVVLLRKVILLVPLAIVLPRLGLGAFGIYLAEPISDGVAALTCGVLFACKIRKMLGEMCIRDRFYIVPRCVLFYQRVFKRQRFHFGVTENILETVHRRRHSLCFQIFFTVAKVLRHTVAQLARFSDINDLSARVLHYIHTGTERDQARFP